MDHARPRSLGRRSSASATRRDFLRATSAVGAAALLPVRPLWAQGSSEPEPRDKVRLAMVGTAQRGLKNLKQFERTKLARVVALCDVHQEQEEAKEAASGHPNAKLHTDFRRMFDEMADEIDAVAVSTADHSHFAVAMHAMMLGKHVYVEKPLAHTFGQCARLMNLAESSGVVTQMGNQGHSSANHAQAKAWSEAGVFRDVDRITVYMNRRRRWHPWETGIDAYPEDPQPEGIDWESWAAGAVKPPFSGRMHPGDWRGWFSHGCGAFGDWGPHLLDTPHRFLRLGLPHTITAVDREGLSEMVYPNASTVRFSFPAREQMPPLELTWHDGQDNLPSFEPGLGSPDPETGAWVPFAADKAKPSKLLHAGERVFHGRSHTATLNALATSEEAWARVDSELPGWEELPSNHWTNFLRACMGEEEARSPFSVGGPLTQVLNLGMLVQRFGGELKFDAASGRIVNHEQADALLDPPPRAGWELYHQL